ncbi:DMT family transporter [Desulfobacula sp.]|uniref:DMT family transporter n=1 Tax=Desulfobacula sp. TaxID=2593537 RepID=UPI0025C2EC19|nr:DMT family transporter [Desulfobacula sp.]MBC2703965.1 DMT family transporter [Desulfobacula sp.]
MKPNNAALDFKGVLLLILLCASWGFNQVAIKVAIEGISPVLQAGIRSIGATILVLIWMNVRRIPVLAKDNTLWWGIAVGLLFSIEFILIYRGLNFTNASRAVIFLNTSPFAVALGAQLFIPGEKLNKIQVSGLCLAFIGIIIAFNESLNLPTRQMLIGDIMLTGAAVIWGATTVVIKAGPLASIAPSKTLLYQLGISAMVLPAVSPAFGEPGITNMTPLVITSLFYQIVWIAFITYIAWFWLISNYAVSRLASFTFLTPFFGVIAGAVFLNEQITLYLICALVLVGTGIYLVNRH